MFRTRPRFLAGRLASAARLVSSAVDPLLGDQMFRTRPRSVAARCVSLQSASVKLRRSKLRNQSLRIPSLDHVSFMLRFHSQQRDAATAPNVGDRVPYVIIKAAKGAKAYERSEDRIYVLENSIPIDPHYYLENQISKPLLRIFQPILKNASKELLQGSHTRSIPISTPSNSGIMRFAKKQLTCIGCKALIRG